MLPAWPYPPPQQSAIRAASCQPSFWYLYFHRILITLCLGFLCLPILSCLLLAVVVISRCWPLYCFMCTSLSEPLIFLLKKEKEKQCHIDRLLSHIFYFFPADEMRTPFMAAVHLFFFNLFLFSHLFYVQGLTLYCKTGINHNKVYDKQTKWKGDPSGVCFFAFCNPLTLLKYGLSCLHAGHPGNIQARRVACLAYKLYHRTKYSFWS